MSVFTVIELENALPLVFDSPHSGQNYPDDFRYACNFHDLQKAEDTYVDDLFSDAPKLGGSLLLAHTPRSYIDLNRAPDDIDLTLTDHVWPVTQLGQIQPTGRSDAGIGLIRRLVKPGIPVYDRILCPTEIHHRIQHYYYPYHNALHNLIENAHYNFGQAWHINCHSMPDSTAHPHRKSWIDKANTTGVDFVIGNRDGTTASGEFTRAIIDCIKSLGYSVAINDPFKGVELIQRYSAPTRGRHSIQLEINKRLYMNEETLEKNNNYHALKSDINKLIKAIAHYAETHLVQRAAD